MQRVCETCALSVLSKRARRDRQPASVMSTSWLTTCGELARWHGYLDNVIFGAGQVISTRRSEYQPLWRSSGVRVRTTVFRWSLRNTRTETRTSSLIISWDRTSAAGASGARAHQSGVFLPGARSTRVPAAGATGFHHHHHHQARPPARLRSAGGFPRPREGTQRHPVLARGKAEAPRPGKAPCGPHGFIARDTLIGLHLVRHDNKQYTSVKCIFFPV